jgi:cell filamentation protein
VTLGGYDAFDDPYGYKGSNCLKNRLGLRDPGVLQAFELEMSSLRAAEALPTGRFGPPHYRRVHWHLSRDVYAWAGRHRTVRTAKGDNRFCFPEFIGSQMDLAFARLQTASFLPGVDSDVFLSGAAEFVGELNAIHPFRDGNGRAQLAFLHLVALRAGQPLRLDRIRPERFMPAMIQSFDGDLAALRKELAALRR